MPRPNPLERYFDKNTDREIHKWVDYFPIYHRHFRRFRHKPVTVVEFGVSYGGSVKMWKHYFGRRAKVFGIDIDERCRRSAEPGIEIMIGDQANRDFLKSVVERTGPIDVLIEDGGHHPQQQINTFEVLYPNVKPNGVFLIEDLHTSYWPGYTGGLGRAGTFMEYAKRLTDQLSAWHTRESQFQVDDFTKTTHSMTFYDSIIVFEKKPMRRPSRKKTGVPGF